MDVKMKKQLTVKQLTDLLAKYPNDWLIDINDVNSDSDACATEVNCYVDGYVDIVGERL